MQTYYKNIYKIDEFRLPVAINHVIKCGAHSFYLEIAVTKLFCFELSKDVPESAVL